MQFFVGTSGYSYPKWKGSFYPAKLPAKHMLNHYSQQFAAVEINGSFYKMPTLNAVETWTTQVPDSFRFALKAPMKITHQKRLKTDGNEVDTLIATATALKGRFGPLLFQLPPNFKKDLGRLEPFLNRLGGRVRAAFEFRHPSWLDDEVFASLRANSCALCVADAEELPASDLVGTSNWGYLRLRREDYSDESLRKWIERLRALGWDEAFVFFKHEDTGTGPTLASRFLELAGQ